MPADSPCSGASMPADSPCSGASMIADSPCSGASMIADSPWKSYFKYDCPHALCYAHLLRVLVFLHEQHKQVWAQAMIDHLLTIKQAVANARTAQRQALPDTEKVSLSARYNRIFEEGHAENPRAQPPSGPKRRARPKQTKALHLLDRFRDHSPSILAFLHDFSAPFANNHAERDLRLMKVRQKISGIFRRLFLGDPFLPTPNSS